MWHYLLANAHCASCYAACCCCSASPSKPEALLAGHACATSTTCAKVGHWHRVPIHSIVRGGSIVAFNKVGHYLVAEQVKIHLRSRIPGGWEIVVQQATGIGGSVSLPPRPCGPVARTHPGLCRAPLLTAERLQIERPCLGDVVHWERQVKGWEGRRHVTKPTADGQVYKAPIR